MPITSYVIHTPEALARDVSEADGEEIAEFLHALARTLPERGPGWTDDEYIGRTAEDRAALGRLIHELLQCIMANEKDPQHG